MNKEERDIIHNDLIVVICGPTAVGKTDIALDIARRFDMEIVSCDSMQIYKYMDIGSAKPSKEELSSVPHHMIDVLDPRDFSKSQGGKTFSVVQFSAMAQAAIDDIIHRGKIPLIVGGTGLYLDSIIYDIDFAASPGEDEERLKLFELAEEEGPEKLHQILKELDPEASERIHPNNIKRVVRAIEAAREGRGVKEFKRSFEPNKKYIPILIGLTRNRDELYERINRRVDIMINNGLIDEVKRLSDMGLTEDDYPMKGIGYKELMPFVQNNLEDKSETDNDLNEIVDEIKTNSRHYAKRQITWFKRYKDMKWFDLSENIYSNNLNESFDASSKDSLDSCDILEEIEEWLIPRLTKK